MKALVRSVMTLAILCLVETTVDGAENVLPEEVRKILETASQLEILSLEPGDGESVTAASKDGFHGYEVLGKNLVRGDVQKDLVKAFTNGMSGQIEPAKCFHPRHGIRAKHDGKTVDLVICFSCSQFLVYIGSDDKFKRLLVNKEPTSVFNKIFKDAGVRMAK